MVEKQTRRQAAAEKKEKRQKRSEKKAAIAERRDKTNPNEIIKIKKRGGQTLEIKRKDLSQYSALGYRIVS